MVVQKRMANPLAKVLGGVKSIHSFTHALRTGKGPGPAYPGECRYGFARPLHGNSRPRNAHGSCNQRQIRRKYPRSRSLSRFDMRFPLHSPVPILSRSSIPHAVRAYRCRFGRFARSCYCRDFSTALGLNIGIMRP